MFPPSTLTTLTTPQFQNFHNVVGYTEIKCVNQETILPLCNVDY